MPEFQNPDLQSRNARNDAAVCGNTRLWLVFTVVALLLFSALHSASLQKPPARSIVVQAAAQPQTARTNFGWLSFIATPLYFALRFLHEHGIANWGWAIIVSTAIFNLLTLWPRIMSLKSSLTMMRIQPKVEALKRRYAHLKAEDPKRAGMNAEMMGIYKQEGASLYGGCLPTLLQLPLLFAYFRVLQSAAELHQAHWYWIADLSAPDPLHILPIFIVVTMFLTQFIAPSPGMDPAQRRIFLFVTPIFMGFTLWRYASGLALYWAAGNLTGLLIQFGINRTRMGKEMIEIAAKRTRAAERHSPA